MVAVVHTRASNGMQAPLVMVETHLSFGTPGMIIVGLPETAIKESRDRVRSALRNANFELPKSRIIINLAPADLPKEGSRFDLPIALSILAASGQICKDKLTEYEFAGELALSGALRYVTGLLPFALATQHVKKTLIMPASNANEVALIKTLTVLPAQHLLDVCAHLNQTTSLTPLSHTTTATTTKNKTPDLAEVNGQTQAKRALEIAAAGGHSLLLVGPPGTGKTMLAKRLPSILPDLTTTEALEVAIIYSLRQQRQSQLQTWQQRPFRAPHHTASSVALVGGGSQPRPGEISLAHHGVLFLDELPEFNRHTLETLREPLEAGKITISRAARQAEFPCEFQLIAAMNPCPCGHLNDPDMTCRCSQDQIQRYHHRLSGPLLDRIDLHIHVAKQNLTVFSKQNSNNETSQAVKQRVMQARQRQLARQAHKLNFQLSSQEVVQTCQPDEASQQLLQSAAHKFSLSMRAQQRILKVALTIADLANSKQLQQEHISEALSYRQNLTSTMS